MFKQALVSVSNKEGLVDFIKPVFASGAQIISTGGTAKNLSDAGVEVKQVSDFTGHPEVMGGRVKTLHPKVHMSLLARRNEPEDFKILEEHGIEAFDLVVVNLYPFEEKAHIENVDIGGPCMLRAAAKSYDRITVVCDPADYEWVREKGADISLEDRKKLAAKAFRHVSAYDAMISKWLEEGEFSKEWSYGARIQSELRYGENPHQKAFWYSEVGQKSGLNNAKIIQGKALSYNNLLDLNAAVRSARSLTGNIACVAVKHLNPCGAAQDTDVVKAVDKALKADPKSVFGGIVAVTSEVNKEAAELLAGLFLECVVAPSFSVDALKVFEAKKNLRILEWAEMNKASNEWDVRSIDGGVLLQEVDQAKAEWSSDWKVIGEDPSEKLKADLVFAWNVCANLKSNAIAVIEDEQTRGLGMGQVNRVDAVAQALGRAKEYHPNAQNLVLASDAFFPFPDSIDIIADAGVKWVVQPGGSIKDEDVIAKAKERGVNLVLTGQRHFNH